MEKYSKLGKEREKPYLEVSYLSEPLICFIKRVLGYHSWERNRVERKELGKKLFASLLVNGINPKGLTKWLEPRFLSLSDLEVLYRPRFSLLEESKIESTNVTTLGPLGCTIVTTLGLHRCLSGFPLDPVGLEKPSDS